MSLIKSFYKKIINLAKHPYSIFFLSAISFFDAIFLPLAPDILFISMVASNYFKNHYLILVTISFSILGGVVSYLIGYFIFPTAVWPIINSLDLIGLYQKIILLFDHWGLFTIVIVFVTPVPYKFFSLSAGMVKFNFFVFFFGSFVGRYIRFYILSNLAARV